MSKKLVSLFLALAMVLACVPAFAEGGVTITDMTGREIALDGPAAKIVALTASDVEIIYVPSLFHSSHTAPAVLVWPPGTPAR